MKNAPGKACPAKVPIISMDNAKSRKVYTFTLLIFKNVVGDASAHQTLQFVDFSIQSFAMTKKCMSSFNFATGFLFWYQRHNLQHFVIKIAK